MPRLSVVVDGVAMEDGAARALWGRFSAWMEEHKGDLAGFAEREGFASVHPKRGPEGAVLEASRREGAKQEAYGNAREVKGKRRG